MKNLFAVSVLTLLAQPLIACPNLSGHFTCKDFDSGAVQDVTTTQEDSNGVTSYHMTIVSEGKSKTFHYVANGQAISIENPEYTSMTEKSSCEGANLKTEVNGVVKENGAVLKALMTTTINTDGNMYDSYIGTMGSNPIHFEEVCQRVQ